MCNILRAWILAKDKTGTELYINSEKDANMETRRNYVDGNMEYKTETPQDET